MRPLHPHRARYLAEELRRAAAAFDAGNFGGAKRLLLQVEAECAKSQVRSARVHLTLPEKGLFRDEDRKASAAVVLTLQPGRTLDEREIDERLGFFGGFEGLRCR